MTCILCALRPAPSPYDHLHYMLVCLCCSADRMSWSGTSGMDVDNVVGVPACMLACWHACMKAAWMPACNLQDYKGYPWPYHTHRRC